MVGLEQRGEARSRYRMYCAPPYTKRFDEEEEVGAHDSDDQIGQQDCNIQLKQESFEYLTKVVPESDHTTGNSNDLDELKVKVNVKDVSAKKPPTRRCRVRRPRIALKRISTFAAVVAAALINIPQTQGQNARPIWTGQDLSADCEREFEQRFRDGYGCPERDGFRRDEWEKLNDLGCSGYKGTALHCYQNYEDGVETGTPACLVEENIPAGHYAKIETNETRYPYLNISRCPPGKYRLEDKMSSHLRYDYCFDQDKGNNETMEQVCDSGPAEWEDRFMCRLGFTPVPDDETCRSAQGFSPNSRCHCQHLNCSNGKQPSRNFTISTPVPSCSRAPQGVVRYGCDPVSTSSGQAPSKTSPSSSQAPSKTSPSSGQAPSKTSPSPSTSSSPRSTATPSGITSTTSTSLGNYTGMTVGVAVVVAVLVVVGLIVFGIWWRSKKHSGTYNTSETKFKIAKRESEDNLMDSEDLSTYSQSSDAE